MYRCTGKKTCYYNDDGCCIECTNTAENKKVCACDCKDYFKSPEKCPLSKRVYKSDDAGETESDL